ncbi:MAG: AraC family transcriptional regulator [bacterium]|nr:AraC family transcriptional regulator [bacterium]
MKQYINILTIVNCIAAVHGVFLSFILAGKKKNRKANIILAAMVLFFSIGVVGPVYVATGLYVDFWWLAPFLHSLPYSFGPLLYFYIKALTTPGFRFSRLQWLHALPIGLSGAYFGAVFFMTETVGQEFLYNAYFKVSAVTYISIVLSLAQALVYILLCLKLFKSHSQKIKKSYSDLEKINLAWIRHLLVLFIVAWVVTVGLQSLLPEELLAKKLDDAITFFLLSLFIFTIGYRGLSQPEIFDLQPIEQEEKGEEGDVRQEAEAEDVSPAKTKKYEKTGLSSAQSLSVKERLLGLMTESRLYLEPTLTLPQVAEQMNLPVHQLSQVINDNMEQNFYRFINSYRIKEAMQRLGDSRTAGDKLIKIAFDSGFNSLSTFNRVFKELNGQSPSQYRKNKQAAA